MLLGGSLHSNWRRSRWPLAAREACRQVGSPPQNKFNDQKFLNLWQPEEPPRVCHNTRPFYKKLPHMCLTRPKWEPQIINATLAELWHAKRQPKSHWGNPSKSHIQTKFTSPIAKSAGFGSSTGQTYAKCRFFFIWGSIFGTCVDHIRYAIAMDQPKFTQTNLIRSTLGPKNSQTKMLAGYIPLYKLAIASAPALCVCLGFISGRWFKNLKSW